MRGNKDKRIKLPTSFLKDRTVMYIDSRTGASHLHIKSVRTNLLVRLRDFGYTFIYLPDLADNLEPSLLGYMFPGGQSSLFVEEMYQRIQELAGLEGKAGFLYKLKGKTYFRVISESADEIIDSEIDDLIDFLSEQAGRKGNVHFSKKARCRRESIDFGEDICFEPEGSPHDIEEYRSEPYYSGADAVRYPIDDSDESLDERTKRIILAWEKIEQEFGITIEDLDIILGYRVKLSRLTITTAGKVILSDWAGGTEVKMDDLTKALYFFYLRHPEGVALKELQTYEREILHYYMTITGRDDPQVIRNSVQNLLDPYSNNLNVCMSRIKKAFKDIVGDRIAKFYYVDGRYAGPRKIALDRDYVIWEN